MIAQHKLLLILSFIVITVGCQPDNDKKNDYIVEPFNVGQFTIIQGESITSKGNRVPIFIKLNTSNGDTWILKSDTVQHWVSVLDDVDPLGILTGEEKVAALKKKYGLEK